MKTTHAIAHLREHVRRNSPAWKRRKIIERGIDCIVRSQVVVDGTPPVWCVQNDDFTLAAAKARANELASLSGSKSAGILKYLMNLNNPIPEVVVATHGTAMGARALPTFTPNGYTDEDITARYLCLGSL